MKVMPTKASLRNVLPAETPRVVTKATLAAGMYSAVFPQDAGLTGPRNGHLGSTTVTSKKTK